MAGRTRHCSEQRDPDLASVSMSAKDQTDPFEHVCIQRERNGVGIMDKDDFKSRPGLRRIIFRTAVADLIKAENPHTAGTYRFIDQETETGLFFQHPAPAEIGEPGPHQIPVAVNSGLQTPAMETAEQIGTFGKITEVSHHIAAEKEMFRLIPVDRIDQETPNRTRAFPAEIMRETGRCLGPDMQIGKKQETLSFEGRCVPFEDMTIENHPESSGIFITDNAGSPSIDPEPVTGTALTWKTVHSAGDSSLARSASRGSMAWTVT